MSIRFAFPTNIVFGAGAVADLARALEDLGSQRPLIVTDAALAETPTFRTVRTAVSVPTHIFSDIQSNPTEQHVEAGTRAFVEHQCDAVIGVGGGSAIDVAKVIRLRATRPQWSLRQPISADADVGALAPLVAIPTTAGTGSEVGRSSVITIDGQKRVIFHPSLLAQLVILDPQLTVELPPKLTAATGADALTHCIESFTSPVFHPPCDGIALEGIRLISRSLPRAVREPQELDARGRMLVAAMMGGIAFQKDLGAAHSLAHPLSSVSGLHHGLANALVLPTVMRFNAQRKPGLYERVGESMELGSSDDKRVIEAIESLLREIGILPGLRAHGVQDDQLARLADQAFADECHRTNPVPVRRDELLQLYLQAM